MEPLFNNEANVVALARVRGTSVGADPAQAAEDFEDMMTEGRANQAAPHNKAPEEGVSIRLKRAQTLYSVTATAAAGDAGAEQTVVAQADGGGLASSAIGGTGQDVADESQSRQDDASNKTDDESPLFPTLFLVPALAQPVPDTRPASAAASGGAISTAQDLRGGAAVLPETGQEAPAAQPLAGEDTDSHLPAEGGSLPEGAEAMPPPAQASDEGPSQAGAQQQGLSLEVAAATAPDARPRQAMPLMQGEDGASRDLAGEFAVGEAESEAQQSFTSGATVKGFSLKVLPVAGGASRTSDGGAVAGQVVTTGALTVVVGAVDSEQQDGQPDEGDEIPTFQDTDVSLSDVSVSDVNPAKPDLASLPAAAAYLQAGAIAAPASPQATFSERNASVRAIFRQLSDSVTRMHDGAVEVTLSPDDLGPVRVTMHGSDHAVTVMVHADRADTLALVRRDLEALTQELQSAGYSDVTFSFSGGEGGADNEGRGPDPGPPSGAMAPMAAEEQTEGPAGGLDLRI